MIENIDGTLSPADEKAAIDFLAVFGPDPEVANPGGRNSHMGVSYPSRPNVEVFLDDFNGGVTPAIPELPTEQ